MQNVCLSVSGIFFPDTRFLLAHGPEFLIQDIRAGKAGPTVSDAVLSLEGAESEGRNRGLSVGLGVAGRNHLLCAIIIIF